MDLLFVVVSITILSTTILSYSDKSILNTFYFTYLSIKFKYFEKKKFQYKAFWVHPLRHSNLMLVFKRNMAAALLYSYHFHVWNIFYLKIETRINLIEKVTVLFLYRTITFNKNIYVENKSSCLSWLAVYFFVIVYFLFDFTRQIDRTRLSNKNK